MTARTQEHVNSFYPMAARVEATREGLKLARYPLVGTEPLRHKYKLTQYAPPTPSEEQGIRLRFEHHPKIAEQYIKHHKKWSYIVDRLWEVDSILRMIERGEEPGEDIKMAIDRPAHNV